MCMLSLFVLLRRIAEPISFLSLFFPPMWKRKRWIFRASASTEKGPLPHPCSSCFNVDPFQKKKKKMLQRLADLKCFVQDLGSRESYLTERAEIKMTIVEVLQIPHVATIYFQSKISLRENACFIGEKSCLNRRSWRTFWLLLLPPPCIHAKSFYCGKRFS